MSREASRITTYNCDANGCTNSVTLIGDTATDQAFKSGWDVLVFSSGNWDLCPDCTKELRRFMFGTDVISAEAS